MKYITIKDFEKIRESAEAKATTIPAAHCRQKREAEESAVLNGIKSAKERTPGKPKFFIYETGENLGTKKWSHWIRIHETMTIRPGTKETEKTWGGIRKSSILAVVK